MRKDNESGCYRFQVNKCGPTIESKEKVWPDYIKNLIPVYCD